MKLKAINGVYIRKLAPEKFKELAVPYIRQTCKREDIDLDILCSTLQPRAELFTDIPEQVDFIDALPEYDIALYTHKKMKTNPENALDALQRVLPVLEAIPAEDFNHDRIHEDLFKLIEEMGVKNGIVLWPIRVAVSGKQFTPGGGIELCAILGKDDTIARIKKGIEKLS